MSKNKKNTFDVLKEKDEIEEELEFSRSDAHATFIKNRSNILAKTEREYGVGLPQTNVIRELNLESDRVQRRRRTQAYKDPDTFHKERDEAYESMEEQIVNAYDVSFHQHIQAGKSAEYAKQKALVVAKAVKNSLEDGIKSEFGDDSNMIAKSRTMVKSVGNTITDFKELIKYIMKT